MTINWELWSWFDAGSLVPAILGQGDFFRYDPSYMERHNRLLILSQLALWAEERQAATQAEAAVHDAIREAIAKRDLWQTFDIVWCVLLVEEHYETPLPVSFRPVHTELVASLHECGGDLVENDELATLVTSVQARVPGLS